MKAKLFLLVLVPFFLAGCSIGRKSWGMATSADAFKVVLADPQSGNAVPEIIAGGGSHSIAFQTAYADGKNYPTMFVFSRRNSLWGIFTSDILGSNVSSVYIAGSDETPEDTVKIINALSKVVNPNNEQQRTNDSN